MQGHATRRQVIAGVLAQRGMRAGTDADAGRTWAAEGHGRRLIFCTRNRMDSISGFAKNGDAPENQLINDVSYNFDEHKHDFKVPTEPMRYQITPVDHGYRFSSIWSQSP